MDYHQMAYQACVLLRQKLAQDEMKRRFLNEQGIRFDYNPGIVYKLDEPYIFSTREQYNKFRASKILDNLADRYLH